MFDLAAGGRGKEKERVGGASREKLTPPPPFPSAHKTPFINSFASGTARVASQSLPRCLQPRLMGPHIHPDVGWRRPPWISIFISSHSSKPRRDLPSWSSAETSQDLSTRTQRRVRGPPWTVLAVARQQALGGIQTQETDCSHATVIQYRGDACLSAPPYLALTRTPKQMLQQWMRL